MDCGHVGHWGFHKAYDQGELLSCEGPCWVRRIHANVTCGVAGCTRALPRLYARPNGIKTMFTGSLSCPRHPNDGQHKVVPGLFSAAANSTLTAAPPTRAHVQQKQTRRNTTKQG